MGDVRRRLAQIDRTTLAGQRDYALLSVALITGRRRAELAGLRAGHVQPRSDGRVRLTWAKVKASEDPMYDTLPGTLSTLLLSYLHRVYGARLGNLPANGAVWVSMSNNHAGGALRERALTDICQARLGTTSVHRLRHTFAHTMRLKGADVTEIQKRLGHKSISTTAIYLDELVSDENRLAEALVAELGWEINYDIEKYHRPFTKQSTDDGGRSPTCNLAIRRASTDGRVANVGRDRA